MDPSVLDVLDVDDIILRLLDGRWGLLDGRGGKRVEVSEGEIRQLCLNARELFLRQPCLLDLTAPVQIVGDTHGHYQDLLRIFEYGGFPPTSNYLFLGNYVDFGLQSLETILLLLAFKTRYPENFFLLKGIHECASVSRIYESGFFDECKRRFNVRLWKNFVDCFNCMPVAALVDDRIFCVHGGLSPDLDNLGQIRDIERPTDIPDSGLLCDLLWSDPSKDVTGWGLNTVRGVTFGEDKVTEFIEKHDLDLICRGNQVVEDGYEFFASRQCVTIFSAPNFRREFDNAGAIMSVDENLVCSFDILKPRELFLGKKPAERVKKPYVWSWSNTNANKSESSSGLKSESSSRLKSPGFKLSESEKKQNSGSLNVTSSESSSGIEPPPKVVFDPSSLYRSKSPGVKRFLGARV